MNKSELISAIAESSNLTKADAGRTFEVQDRAARSARNPRTGEGIQIKATKNPALKPVKHSKMLSINPFTL